MLSAQKALLHASVQEQGVQLQSQELTYFTSNFSMISTMASVIAGFAFAGLIISPARTGAWLTQRKSSVINSTVIGVYYGCASGAIGTCLLACIICTVINVRGSGLALRGPDGSLKRAVDSMRLYQRYALLSLSCGVVFFHLEGMLYAWLELTLKSSIIVVTVLLGLVLIGMCVVIYRIFAGLAIVKGQLVAGDLTDAQLAAVVRRLEGKTSDAEAQDAFGSSSYGATDVLPEEKHDDHSTSGLFANLGFKSATS